MNLLWVFIPIWLMRVSYVEIASAMRPKRA